ncbi:mechanosensitive ion channel family protein [Catenovulum sediminis]|uniref:mechanosensitive ion channel family protein n=1 Tax=Catenovulum sediminis TaxID=1740262 RepID=UPI00117FF862|nr:mechanosensitive ion channel family protein [Catenovulum sediminis]
MLEYFTHISQSKLLLSAAVLSALLIARAILIKSVQRKYRNDIERKRRWSSGLKNLLNFITLLTLAAVWFDEIQSFAISIAAFVVAIVLATREYIQCILASLYQTGARQYRIGDWVEVNGCAGEVAYTDWITTTLYELNLKSSAYQYSGKTLVIPNNQFITHSFVNLNYMRRYVNHGFLLIQPEPTDPIEVRAFLLSKLTELCLPFKDTAERYRNMIERKLDIVIPGAKVKVNLATTELGHAQYSVQYFCPTEKAQIIEQKVTQAFFQFTQQQKQSATKDSPSPVE